MSVLGIPQLMLPAEELIETMTGSDVFIGALTQVPIKIIFNNLGTVEVLLSISFDGGSTLINWHTFSSGEGIVVDCDLYTFPRGTSFYGNGASGDFSVSYLYLKQ